MTTAGDANAGAAGREAVPSAREMEQAIRCRAQEIYESEGKAPGHEVENWLRAEAEVMREVTAALRRRTAHIVVKVDGVTYTGEYDPESCAGYQPGEFGAGPAAACSIRRRPDVRRASQPRGTGS